jgi:hypothetical protein
VLLEAIPTTARANMPMPETTVIRIESIIMAPVRSQNPA